MVSKARRPGALTILVSLVAAILAQLVGMTAAAAAVDWGQNFDGVTAPALPSGWTSSGTLSPWVTSTAAPDTPPNAASITGPAQPSSNVLDSPAFVAPQNGTLTFRHKYDLQTSRDGAVLEIRYGGLDFRDFVARGGSFAIGGYNASIPNSVTFSPLANRPAWTGNSGGYVTTTAYLPADSAGQNDAYDAMTQRRPHRPALTDADAARELRKEADGGRLDSVATDAVLSAADQAGGRARSGGPAGLTARENDVLALLAQGLANKAIASTLRISPKTIGSHVERIYLKLGVTNRAAATMRAVQHGVVGTGSAQIG